MGPRDGLNISQISSRDVTLIILKRGATAAARITKMLIRRSIRVRPRFHFRLLYII